MIFHPTPIVGAFVIELEPLGDDRGSFARSFCRRELADHGVTFEVAQCNLARSRTPGTVRGIHYQLPPATEQKLVRCTAGEVFDVVVDLRPGSSTLHQVYHVRLSAENRLALLIPGGVGHGYQVLAPDTEIFYMADEFYAPEYETGVRFDDPELGVPWPLPAGPVADRDRRWPLLTPR